MTSPSGDLNDRAPWLSPLLAFAGLLLLLVAGVWHSVAASGTRSADVGTTTATAPAPVASPWPVLDLPDGAAPARDDTSAAPAPTTLALPRQRVDAPVLAMGQQDRALDLPEDPRKIGWWSAGAAPGDRTGTTLLAGHIDSRVRGIGVLAALRNVSRDDPVTVQDGAGRVHRYVVTSRHTYPKADLPASVFTTAGSPRLVLVTCAGAFDPVTRHYADNVVVVAEPA